MFGVRESRYWTVSINGRFADAGVGTGPPGCGFVAQVKSVTGQLAPVPVTTICDEVGEEDDVVVQPLNMVSPIALTTNRSSICKRRRFLRPRKQSAAANIVDGNNGLGPWWRAAVSAGTARSRGPTALQMPGRRRK